MTSTPHTADSSSESKNHNNSWPIDMSSLTAHTGPKLLLSSDTLNGYGLDLIFSMAKESGYDGIDLAMWKNIDSRHGDYIAKLMKQHDLSVLVVQTSSKLNAKELNQAIAICDHTGATQININAPTYFDMKTASFISNNLASYIERYPHLHFNIINPDSGSMTFLPLPQYRFSNILETTKKLGCWRAVDVANMDEDMIDTVLLKRFNSLSDHIHTIYLSDRSPKQSHIILGDGDYKIPQILEMLAEHDYQWYLTTKYHLTMETLVDTDKILLLLEKTQNYIRKHYSIK